MAKAYKRKIARNGRNACVPFVRVTVHVLHSPAYRALGRAAQAAYPWVLLAAKGGTVVPNGGITLPSRRLAAALGCSSTTPARALQDLQAKGFLVVRKPAVLGVEGEAKAPRYDVTELPMPGETSGAGCNPFRQWREGCDFEVKRSPAHNLRGRNGRGKAQNLHRIAQHRPPFATKPGRRPCSRTKTLRDDDGSGGSRRSPVSGR